MLSAAFACGLLTACASAPPTTAPRVELPFPSPLAGPGRPEVERREERQLEQGWRSLTRSDLAAAAAVARATGHTASGRLLGLQVELLEPGHQPAARIAALVEQHPGWAAAWLTLSVAAEQEGDERTAYEAAVRGAELWERPRWQQRSEELHRMWVDDRIDRAAEHIAAGEYEPALTELAGALDIEPDQHHARLLRIEALTELDRLDEAEAALADLGEDPETVVLTARVAERRQDWQQAMALYRSLPEDFPGRAEALRRAQIRWRLSVLPGYVRDALDSQALTRAELAIVLVALAPEIEAVEGGQVPVLWDIVDLPSQREVLAVVRADLMTVDPVEHRFHPQREATVAEITDAVEALCHLLGFQVPQWCDDDPNLVTSACTQITPPVGGEFLAELVLGLTRRAEP